MKKNIKVSILMPTYNHEKFIAKAINSALMQKTNFKWELLIHDDCSTDSTKKIAESFAEKYPDRIILITEKENQGLLKSYKKLLSIAKGAYLAILESDDYWMDENKLQMQSDFLENNEDYGIIATDILEVDEQGGQNNNQNFKNRSKRLKETEYWYEQLLGNRGIYGACSVMFRKLDFEKYCNIDEWVKLQFKTFDHPAWLSISFNKKCKYIPKVTAAYRVLLTSISNSKDAQKQMNFNIAIAQIEEYIISKFGYGTLSPSQYNHIICTCIMGKALKLHKCKEFCTYAKKLRPVTLKEKIMHLFPNLYYWQFTARHK